MLRDGRHTPLPMTRLVRRAREGDSAAFEQLYRDNVGRVYAICLRMCADAVRAEELTQDAFVQAWHRLPSFRGDSAFSSWLYRLTVNVVLERERSDRRRERRLPAGDTFAFGEANPRSPPGLSLDLERAIAELPAGARTAFVLRDVEGYEYTEVAEITGRAVGTMKAQVHRARRLLREKLESWRTGGSEEP